MIIERRVMRRVFFCALFCALFCVLPARAARTVAVQVDGTPLSGTCQLEDGVTYVPFRSLLDAFGGWEVYWDAQARQAAAVSGDRRVTADPGSNVLTVDGVAYAGRVTVENGCTYVPLRILTEALGGAAAWDPRLPGAAVTSPGADYDAQALYWLAHIISAESQGEPFSGQIAVGNVVLNRVADDSFPDTIPEVVFDRRGAVQFEPVGNGTVFQAPAPLSVEAAKRVLDGENTAGAAMYFYAPALSRGVWINAHRRYLKTIGGHRFYL